MTHDAHDPRLAAVARWLGVDLAPVAYRRLATFADWLVEEALPAGGIGPREADRVIDRHVCDALTFAKPFGRPVRGRLLDLGSGVGLPGIPLATAFPELDVVLVDRSRRRIDLASRAVRILGIGNVSATVADFGALEPGWEYVTMRAVLATRQAVPVIRRLLAPGGLGVLGLSRSGDPADHGLWGSEADIVPVPPDVLDSPGSILTIRP